MSSLLPGRSAEYVVAYDADCGPCTRFEKAVEALDIHGRADFVTLDEADLSGMLKTVPSDLRRRSFHLATPGGRVLSGAEALPEVLRLFPGGRIYSRLITGAPGGKRGVAFVYSAFARLHDAGECKQDSKNRV